MSGVTPPTVYTHNQTLTFALATLLQVSVSLHRREVHTGGRCVVIQSHLHEAHKTTLTVELSVSHQCLHLVTLVC